MPTEDENEAMENARLKAETEALVKRIRCFQEDAARLATKKAARLEREASEREAILALEQIDAVWLKLGGEEGVSKFLRGETTIVPKKDVVVRRSSPRLKAVLLPSLFVMVTVGMFYSYLLLKNWYNENSQPVVGVVVGPAVALTQVPDSGIVRK